jgi:hypothetical protein
MAISTNYRKNGQMLTDPDMFYPGGLSDRAGISPVSY